MDGYNIIGTSGLASKKTRDDTGLEAARWQLAEALLNHSISLWIKLRVLMPSIKTGSNQEIITQNLSVYYTVADSSITYIVTARLVLIYAAAQASLAIFLPNLCPFG